MNTQLEIGKQYTFIYITGMATTGRHELTITGKNPDGRFTYKLKGKRKEFLLPTDSTLHKDYLIFKGHSLSYVLDSDSNRFYGNARFNFVTTTPQLLREDLEKNCLNPSPEKWAKIMYTTGQGDDPQYDPLFTDPYNISE